MLREPRGIVGGPTSTRLIFSPPAQQSQVVSWRNKRMPIYAFRCEACGHAFDRLQKLSDPDPRECPECGAQAVRRQVTAPAFRLAGSGWYETDFKSDKEKKRNLAGDGPPQKKEESAGEKPAKSGEATAKPAPDAASKPAASAPAEGKSASG